ncbi:MAG: hypothetical protein KAT28_05025 [Candidatus Aenigmarchaeota archaeon]|nr:hypothetical protein [Candidatus Aenigmarchaeota archaeon]
MGETVELSYKIIADSNAEAGLYKLLLSLGYEDSVTGTPKTIITKAGLYVGGGTDFDVAFSETSSGTTSFTIANIGSNPSFSVSVIIPQQEGWKVSGSNSMIIGNLNTGDYTVASFSLESSQTGVIGGFNGIINRTTNSQKIPAQSGNTQNSLRIQIAYTNTMGEREVLEKEVAINTQSMINGTVTAGTGTNFAGRVRGTNQNNFFSGYEWYITLLAVLAVVSLLYRKYKKEKLLNPNFKFEDVFRMKTIFKKRSKSR